MENAVWNAVALWVFLSVGAIALFSFLSVLVWVDCRRRERVAYYRSEVIRKMAELPGATPESLDSVMREQQAQDEHLIRQSLKVGGLVTAMAGLGMMIFLRLLINTPMSMGGLIVLLIGLALLASPYLFPARS